MEISPNDIVEGARVTWPQGGLSGCVVSMDAHRMTIRFDNGNEQIFTIESGVIERDPFTTGDYVVGTGGAQGVAMEWVPGQPYPTWKVLFPNGPRNIAELSLKRGIIGDPVERVRAGEFDPAPEFNLKSVTADLWYRHLHDALVSLAHARVDLKPHQVSVTHRVVTNYPHRFLLCDEVGLGKTIEAAMIIKELRARGLARRVLVIVPSGLQRQWQFELKTKFNETFAILNRATVASEMAKGTQNPWVAYDSVITSQSWAPFTETRRKEITSVDWDLVIVDEAHHAREQIHGNSISRTQLYLLVNELTSKPEYGRRGVLFLTATPLQLSRHELFSLVEMLNPVLFESEQDFIDHFDELSGLNRTAERLTSIRKLDGKARTELINDVAGFLDTPASDVDARLAASPSELIDDLRSRHRLSEVMIRNRRSVIGGFQPRSAYRLEVDLSEREHQVHELIEDMVKEGFRSATGGRANTTRFLMVMWQKLAASSSNALAESLRRRRERLMGSKMGSMTQMEAEERLGEDAEAATTVEALPPAISDEVERLNDLIKVIDRVEVDSKAIRLVAELDRIFANNPNDKVIVFTEFRETQSMLAKIIGSRGWGIHQFHGQLSPLEKDRAVDRFREDAGAQILVSTEAGGEGRNFQFAHVLVNYDLPWNPMRVEQRIGRVDRIGQKHPVSIFNFHVSGTIESRILEVLEDRIKIFEDSIGGLDPILGDAESDIRNAMVLTGTAREKALNQFAADIGLKVEEARRAQLQLRDLILDTKSFSAEIAQTATESKEPITQQEFETFVVRLMQSANTWVGQPNHRGEREVQFHPPFTEEHPKLIDGLETRRVCLDPRSNVDSEYVEYLGFGHPIIDALVTRVLDEQSSGAAAIRSFKPDPFGLVKPGWHFNWIVKVGGIQTVELVKPVFIPDGGHCEPTIGEFLLRRSREFQFEETDRSVDVSQFESAFQAAQSWIGTVQSSLVQNYREEAAEQEQIEFGRIEKLFKNRLEAAQDRIERCHLTLDRVRSSSDSQVRQVIPIWEANLERASKERELIEQDRIIAITHLRGRRNITAEHRLLNVARIEIES